MHDAELLVDVWHGIDVVVRAGAVVCLVAMFFVLCRFGFRNGPFEVMKRAVLECETARFATGNVSGCVSVSYERCRKACFVGAHSGGVRMWGLGRWLRLSGDCGGTAMDGG